MSSNRLALSMSFLSFAAIVLLLRAFIKPESVAYVIASIIFFGASVLEEFGMLPYFRGFLRLSLLIIGPSSTFALAQLGYVPFVEIVLWAAAITMVLALPIFWWMIAKDRPLGSLFPHGPDILRR